MSSGDISTGKGNGGGSDRSKQAEEITMTNADLTAELTSVLRSMIPLIVEETPKNLQGKKQMVQETTKRLKEEELQEWETRKMFFISGPPEYHGYEPKLYNWFREMENAFERCKCSDDHKVLYASFMLRKEGLRLWNDKIKTLGKETLEAMPWDEFKKYSGSLN